MFQVMSVVPFSAKNAFVIAYLLESSLARFKDVVCCYQTISCLLSFREGNERISRLFIFSPMKEYKKFSHKCIHPKHFRVSGIKISNVVTKETNIAADTVALRKRQINLLSLRGDSFTDVGYNIGQVATLLGCINRYHCEFWTGQRWQPNKNVVFRDTTWLFDN